MPQTLYDKLMSAHVVREEAGTALIYIDRQLIHEVTSPQAFEGLEIANRKPWRTQASIAVPDHNVPTTERSSGVSGIQIQFLNYKSKHWTKTVKRLALMKFK